MKAIYEELGLDRDRSISAKRYDVESFDTPWHYHPQHELTYIESSTGTKLIGDYVGSYAPGELVLLRSDLPHCWQNHQQDDTRAISTVLQWNPQVIPAAPELVDVHRLLEKAARGLLFSRSQTEEILPDLLALPTEQGSALYIGLLSMLSRLADMDCEYLSHGSFDAELSREESKRLSLVHEYLDRHYQNKIYLKDMAALLSMKEQSFSRFFTKMMGRPFFSYLNEYRVSQACRLLIDTDWPVTQIAYDSGYEALPFFHRQFAKYKGMTPLAYRRAYR